VTGNFVMLPFRGQGSGKSLPVPCICGTEIKAQGCAENYAHTLRDLSDVHFADAAKIVLVQDNLNTHKPASLYEAFPAAEARRLVERFEWHYTSKHGSWLDMAALVGKRVNLRSAPSSAIIRTSEHFHVFSPPA
jgi:DDE superfamily endonuclease